MHEVHVRGLEVGGREHGSAEQRRLEVRDLAGESLLDAVGVPLSQTVGPGSVADVELVRGVAPDAPRELLQLDPQEPLPGRRPGRVDRQRLADDDGRLGRKQPALGLVDGARNTVETGRHMHDRRLPEPGVADPGRRLGEREVDLHLRPSVAEPGCVRREVERDAAEQTAVELRRRDVADDDRRTEHVAARELYSGSAPVARDHVRHVGSGLACAALLADQRDQSVGEARAAAAWHRHPALLHGDGDHRGHVARRRRVRAEPGVQDPRCEQPVRSPGGKGLRQPVAGRDQKPCSELGRAAPAQPPVGAQGKRRAVPRPELRAEHPEGEVGVGEEPVEHGEPGGAVTGLEAVELGGVRVGGAQQERRLAVRKQRRRRMLGVQILETVTGEVAAEPGVRRAADPERVPGTEDVVMESRLRDLRRLDRAPEPVVPLEHAHVTPGLGEQSGAGEAVDAAADDDRVVGPLLSHERGCGTRRP